MITITQLFEDDKTKVKDFNILSPEGNKIKGKILLNHGEFHGSLFITDVNGKITNQFVRGFPKIHYYDEKMTLDTTLPAFEKLDGTCISFYKLRDSDGNVIEIVPKTRQQAVADEHFLEMLKNCETYLLHNDKSWNYSVLDGLDLDVIHTELFGMLNEHSIPHKQSYIDLRLIGASTGEYMLNTDELKKLSKCFKIELPRQLFTITYDEQNNQYYCRLLSYELNNSPDGWICKDMNDILQNIKDDLDERNKVYMETKGYLKYEGVVLQNCYDKYNHYIKVKPVSFLEAEGMILNVPVEEIRKEITKIINENISSYSEEYNEKEAIKEVNTGLLEEYDESDVKHKRVQNIIIKELHKYLESISDKSINKIVDELIETNPDVDLKTIMKDFGSRYPLLKHRSRDVYFILSKRLPLN